MNRIEDFLNGPYVLNFETSDWWFFYAAAGSLAAAIVTTLVMKFAVRNPVTYNMLRKFRLPLLIYGLTGLVWAGFRYENAAYLNWRLWAVIGALVSIFLWGRAKWYLFFSYKKDLEALRNQELKQKYLK